MVNPRGAVKAGIDKNHPVWLWYDNRTDEQLVLEQTLGSCGIDAVVKEVKFQAVGFQEGASRKLSVLDKEEPRRMFKVVLSMQPTSFSATKELLSCRGVLRPIGCSALCSAQPRLPINK